MVFVEAAQAFAVRILQEAPGEKFADRLNYAYQVSLARSPNELEQERLLGFLQHQKEILAKDPKAAAIRFPYRFQNTDQIEGAAWVDLASVLLNLDELITKE